MWLGDWKEILGQWRVGVQSVVTRQLLLICGNQISSRKQLRGAKVFVFVLFVFGLQFEGLQFFIAGKA